MRLEEERIRKEAEAAEALRAKRRADKEAAKKAEIDRKKKQRDLELGVTVEEYDALEDDARPQDLVKKDMGKTKKMYDRGKGPVVE